MICPHCGRDFSDKVWRIHKERCKPKVSQSRKEAINKLMDEYTKDGLIEIAQTAGVKVDKRWGKARIVEALNASNHA